MNRTNTAAEGGITVGSRVRLRSGGPEMTVRRIVGTRESTLQLGLDKSVGYQPGDVVCQWFAPPEQVVLKEAAFPPASLVVVEQT